MTSNVEEAKKYIERLVRDGYELKQSFELSNDMITCGNVVRAVLTPDSLKRWARKNKKKTRELRKEFNMRPFNKFDKDYDRMINESPTG